MPKTANPDLDPEQGFSRFTPRARNVVMTAQNEARTASNAEIAPEHLALGLLADSEALAAKAIIAQGVALETARRTLIGKLPAACESVPALVPYNSQARKTLELTFRGALRLGHNYIGTEHILLALLELEDSAGVLTGLGINKDAVDQHVRVATATQQREGL